MPLIAPMRAYSCVYSRDWPATCIRSATLVMTLSVPVSWPNGRTPCTSSAMIASLISKWGTPSILIERRVLGSVTPGAPRGVGAMSVRMPLCSSMATVVVAMDVSLNSPDAEMKPGTNFRLLMASDERD